MSDIPLSNSGACNLDYAARLGRAAEWLSLLEDPGVHTDVYSDWLAWIDSSPENSQAFDEITAISGRILKYRELLTELPAPNDIEMLADRYDGSKSVLDWIHDGRKVAAPARKWPYLSAAVFALIAIGLALFNRTDTQDSAPSNQTYAYETGSSQHDLADLDDGTTIEIGADSALTVSYSRDQRTVVLEKGEAFFAVAKDAQRPFVVVAGSGKITAVGTEFNVRRDIERVVVTVTEGSVDVTQKADSAAGHQHRSADGNRISAANATRLVIGEQVAYDPLGITKVSRTDPAFATSWKDGRLQYRREPLRFVVTGVNRYSDINIIIADSDVNDLLFTGTIFDGQTSDWLESLGSVLPVQVEYVGNNTALLKRRN